MTSVSFNKIESPTIPIQVKIERAEKCKQTAAKICKASLIGFAIVVGCTAAFYASPLIPMTLMLLIPVALFFGAMFQATGGGKIPDVSPESQNIMGEILGGLFKISGKAGYEWGKLIFTAKVAVIAGLANAAAAALFLPVAAVSGGIYLAKKREVAHLLGEKANLVSQS